MKIRFILFFVAIGMIMAFAPTNYPLDLRVIPVAPSISDSVWLLGHKKTTGVYTTYRFSMPQLASYLGGAGLGNNFANADLTLPSNRDHDFANYGMDWRNVYYFNFVDTNVDTFISFNNFFNPHNCMIRVSSYGGNGAITLCTKDARTGLSINTPSTTLHCGGTAYQASSNAASAKHTFTIAGVTPMTIDSATHLLTFGVCPNCLTFSWTTGEMIVDNAYRMAKVAPTDSTQVYSGPIGFAADAFWGYPRTAIDHHVIDADYVIPSVNRTVFLPVITADRTLTIPTPTSGSNTSGVMLEIVGQNTGGFNWNLAGATVKKVNATTVTQTNVGMFRLRWEGTYWLTD